MDSFTENPPPGDEVSLRYRQRVRVFANLMRACVDPVDIENLRNFRAETQDFQVAINMFAMLKARESSEQYNMPERVRERKMQEERKKEEKEERKKEEREKEKEEEKEKEKEEEGAAEKERESRLQRCTLLGKDPGARTSDILASETAEGIGLAIFMPRVVQGDDMGSSTPRVVEEGDSGSQLPRVGETAPKVVEGDDSGNRTLLEVDGL